MSKYKYQYNETIHTFKTHQIKLAQVQGPWSYDLRKGLTVPLPFLGSQHPCYKQDQKLT